MRLVDQYLECTKDGIFGSKAINLILKNKNIFLLKFCHASYFSRNDFTC